MVIFTRINGLEVPVDVVKSKGRNIRFTYKDGRGRIALPRPVNSQKLEELTRQITSWLIGLSRKEPELFIEKKPSVFTEPAINIMGQTYELVYKPNIRNAGYYGKIEADKIIFHLPGEESIVNDQHIEILPKLISKLFLSRLQLRVFEVNSVTLRAHFGKITLRSANSRWGSCNHKNDLMFSNRLLLAPLAILDHVIIHELAHIIQKDHSRAFWRIVATHDKDWRDHHHWLKKNGHQLVY